MTFLELCQQVHRLIRVGPELPGSVPSATTAQTGVLEEIVYWTRNAWLDIQAEQQKWKWMTMDGVLSVTLAAGRTYAMSAMVTSPVANPVVTFERVLPMADDEGNEFGLIYLTASGVAAQQRVIYVPYEEFHGFLDIGTRQSGQPRYFTSKQGNQIEFDPTPDATYTFTCPARANPQTLSATTDNPLNWPITAMGLPAHYHQWIAWRAVKLYALSRQDANALYMQADREERAWMEKAVREFTPPLAFDPFHY